MLSKEVKSMSLERKELIVKELKRVYEKEKARLRNELEMQLGETDKNMELTLRDYVKKNDYAGMLDFSKESFNQNRSYDFMSEMIAKVFCDLFGGTSVLITKDSISAKKDLLNFVINTNTFSKTLYVIGTGVEKPYIERTPELFDKNHEPTEFLKAIRDYIKTPSFKNKVNFSNENMKNRTNAASKFFGYKKSFDTIEDERFIKEILDIEKKFYQDLLEYNRLNKSYEKEQQSIEGVLSDYEDLFKHLISLGWVVVFKNVKSKEFAYYKEEIL